jgi:aminobenzoyl-glutamate transport protein
VGVLASVATDAGYLILVPLGATAFVTLKKHPLAGMASAFAGVGAVFAVNLLITPLDSMLTEITNEAIGLADGSPITVLANFFFAVVASFVLAGVVTLVTEFVTNPRLGEFVPEAPVAAPGKKGEKPAVKESEQAVDGPLTAIERKGLRWALYVFLAFTLLLAALIVPSWGPLRHPETGAILGNTPFMDSLIYIITLYFLLAGIAYGFGTGAFKGANDVIAAITKTFSSLAGMVLMLLVISQFIAYFNYSNMPTIAAINMADLLERANIGALPLLIGFILVIVLLDFIMPGSVPKWAIFAPVFIPIFIRLNVAPQTVLAAYRVGDSPVNVITPLMVYLPFVVTIAQRYQKNAGLGTVVALMLPYTLAVLVAFILFFAIWFLLGIPLGPGYPVGV